MKTIKMDNTVHAHTFDTMPTPADFAVTAVFVKDTHNLIE